MSLGFQEYIIENIMTSEYKYLEIITTKSKTIPREGVLAINDDIQGNPFLEIYQDGEWQIIDNFKDEFSAAKLEDLYTTMYERDWMVGGRLYVKDEDELYMTLEPFDNYLPTLTRDLPKFSITETVDRDSSIEFEMLYSRLLKVRFKVMDKDIIINDREIDLGLDYYHWIVSTRNLIDKSSVIDLYSYSENSTDYGNIINLNSLLHKIGDRIKLGGYTIKLVVAYVKSGERKSGSLLFEPYHVDENGKTVYHNFQGPVNNDDVIIEVKGGCVRVFPNNQDVTECIIYQCYVVYEKLV